MKVTAVLTDSHNLKRWARPPYYAGKSWPDWYVGLSRTRDSSCLNNTNFDVFIAKVSMASDGLSILESGISRDNQPMEIDSVFIVRESHWLCGWVEWVAIHKSDVGALRKADELFDELDTCSVLDETLWLDRETVEIEKYWATCSIKERVAHCQDAGDSIFAARSNYPPEKTFDWLRDTWV